MKSYWNAEFKRYSKPHPRLRKIAGLVREFTRPGGMVLDVGCNNGVLREMSGVEHYYGVDFISAGDAEFPFRAYDINSSESLPFEEVRFDTLVMSGILEYARNVSKLLDDAYRRLKEDGILIVSYVNFDHFPRLVGKFLGMKQEYNPTWVNALELDMLRKLIVEAGFSPIREVPVEQGLFGSRSVDRSGAGSFLKSADLFSKQKIFIYQKHMDVDRGVAQTPGSVRRDEN